MSLPAVVERELLSKLAQGEKVYAINVIAAPKRRGDGELHHYTFLTPHRSVSIVYNATSGRVRLEEVDRDT